MARIDMAELRAVLSRMDHLDLGQAVADVDRRDLLDVMYPAGGPHDQCRTEDAAAVLPSLVLYLNHATRTSEGVPEPATLDRIVAGIEAAAAGLQQTTGQVAARLDKLASQPRLASDEMAYRDMSPAAIADRAAVALRQARELLDQLHATLSEVHNHTARLYFRSDAEAVSRG